jgi:hypothetical protein
VTPDTLARWAPVMLQAVVGIAFVFVLYERLGNHIANDNTKFKEIDDDIKTQGVATRSLVKDVEERISEKIEDLKRVDEKQWSVLDKHGRELAEQSGVLKTLKQ